MEFKNQKEVVVSVPLCNEKSRRKAMGRASKMQGVTKIEVVRERNHLVVTSEGIDSVELTESLRKIFCFADVVSVEDVPSVRQSQTSMEEGGHDFQDQPFYSCPPQYYYQHNYTAVPVYDLETPPSCSIM